MAHNTVLHIAGALALSTGIVAVENVAKGNVQPAAIQGAIAGSAAAVAVAANKPSREG